MDVTCERCGTEYEFDETLLSGRGTSVKCTNCGHVFKIYPKAEADVERATSSWRLKLRDGSISTIDSLRELQRRISSGELLPENEIARGDEGWKTLGSIPELETFFQAAGVETASRGIRSPVPASPVPPAPAPMDVSVPAGRRPRQPTLLGVSPIQRVIPAAGGETEAASLSGAEPVSEPGSVSRAEPVSELGSVSVSGAVSEPGSVSVSGAESVQGGASESWGRAEGAAGSEGQSVEIEDAEFEEQPVASRQASTRRSTPPPAYYDDDDDIPSLPGRGGSPLRWLLLLVVVGGLALVATHWGRVLRLLGMGGDPALVAAGVAEGDADLEEGTPQAYASAIEAYDGAIEAGGDRDPEILAKLSNASALAAQAELDEGVAEGHVQRLAAAALTTAQSAVEIDPRNLSARLAQADALRLAGEQDRARAALQEAKSMSFSQTAELFRIDARLSAAEAGGQLQNGLHSANEAVQLAPHGVRYLLLLARAEHAAGDDARAGDALRTILADHPGHPVATKLLTELETSEAVADAGVETAAGAAAETGAGTETETGAEAETGAGAGTAAAEGAAAQSGAAAGTAAETENGGGPTAVEKGPEKGVKARPKRRAAGQRRRRPKKPAYDEYDRLAEAAGDDAFVDGRPPVRDYEWYMRQGRAELAGGNYSRARAFFDSALEAHPGSADAMDGLGQVATGIEDYDSALRYFRVAAQRGHPNGYFNLGKTYERLGRNEEAVSAYYTYLKRRPSGTHAAAAKSAIKTLEPRVKLPSEPEPEPQPEPGAEPSPSEKPAQAPEPGAP